MTAGVTSPKVFIDSNIPMYVIGGDHPNQSAARRLLADAAVAERFDVERARRLVHTTPRLSARDALHVAVMERHSVEQVMSFDADFDRVPGLTRLS